MAKKGAYNKMVLGAIVFDHENMNVCEVEDLADGTFDRSMSIELQEI